MPQPEPKEPGWWWWRRMPPTIRCAEPKVSGTDQQCVRIPFSKALLGQAVGRQELALAAITDPAMALAFLKALPEQSRYESALKSLQIRTTRVQSRQAEARAHEKNVKKGRFARKEK